MNNYIPGIYINCALFPFIKWIIQGKKIYETRNRNTLKRFIGKTVYLVQTGKGKAIVIAIATIDSVLIVESKAAYNKLRKYTMVKRGSIYDFTDHTKRKYLYKLTNVQKLKNPFPVPVGSVKHGYTSIDIPVK